MTPTLYIVTFDLAGLCETTMQDLRDRMRVAETAEEIAEICRLEAVIMGGLFWCPACGVQLSVQDTAPCSLDHGICGIATVAA